MKLILTAALFLLCNYGYSQSTSFNTIQLKVKEYEKKSQWDEMLVTAPELITEEPTKPDGYFYTAMAFSKLQETDKALEYLAMAAQFADEAFKEKIEALKVDISNSEKTNELAETIRKNEGAKSGADNNRKLWELDKTKVEIALNAVELYIGKEDYASALEILNDPSMSADPQAKLLIGKINKLPKVVTLNGYNKAMKEGDEKFKQHQFQSAISKFDQAMTFYPRDVKARSYKRRAQEELAWEVADKLNTIESYKNYIAKYPLGEYKKLAEQILQNSYLKFARNYVKEDKYDEAVNYFTLYQKNYPNGPQINTVNKELCDYYLSEAKRFEKRKNSYSMGRALELYELSKVCGLKGGNEAHLNSLKRKKVRWGREDMGFLGWHADENNLLGFFSGSLNNRKLGFYLAARTGNDFFKSSSYWETDNTNSLDDSPDKDKKFSNVIYNQTIYGTMGLTKKIVYPIWIYVGAGVSANTQLKEFINNTSGEVEYVKNKDEKYIALNPEIGIQVKVAFLTLRYGINRPVTPLFKEDFVQHFGVGFKF